MTSGLTSNRHDNGIYAYRFNDNRRETIDALIDQVYQEELVIHAAGGTNIFILLDIRGQWVTPYGLTRIAQTASLTPPGMTEWIAIVAGDNFASRVVESLMHRFPASVRLTTHVFQQEEPALAWLEQKVQEHIVAKKSE